MPTTREQATINRLITAPLAHKVASDEFNKRSRGGKRNTEVHLTEWELRHLLTVCASAAIIQYRDDTSAETLDHRVKQEAESVWQAIAGDAQASYGSIALSDAVDLVAENMEIQSDLSQPHKAMLRHMEVNRKRALISTAIKAYF